MKNTSKSIVDEISTATAVINYLMNTCMPYLCVLGILMYTNAFEMWVSYLILPFMYFSTRYSFRCGVAHVLAEATEDTEGKLFISAEIKEKDQ